MKAAGGVLAILMILPAAAAAQPAQPDPAAQPAPVVDSPPEEVVSEAGPDLVLTGSFFARYEIRESYQDFGMMGRRIGELDGTAYRARIGLATTPIDIGKQRLVVLEFVPQASGFWGDESGGLADAGLGVHEADIQLHGDAWRLELGRFEMAYGEHLVIGDVGWHETGRSFDGARYHHELSDSGSYIDGFITQVAEGSSTIVATEVGQGDFYFSGVYAGYGPSIAGGLDLDSYLLANIAPQNDAIMPPQDHTAIEITVGQRVKKKLDPVTLRAEGGFQFGKRPVADVSVIAAQIDADAMVQVAQPVAVGGGLFFASGNDAVSTRDEAWNQLFPTAHKFLGMMDVMGGRSNVTGAVAKVRHKALDDLAFAADAHLFFRPESPGADDYTGFEADLWSLYKIGTGLGLRAQYSLFVPNESGPLGGDTLIHYMELQLRYDLK